MLRVREKLMSGPKMARFQQNIRKVSEKKMGRDTNSPVAANGFCTVSEPNCVRLSWIDHTGAGHTTNIIRVVLPAKAWDFVVLPASMYRG